jgi:hypothetical protein
MDIGMVIGGRGVTRVKKYYIYMAVCLNPYFAVKPDVIELNGSF